MAIGTKHLEIPTLRVGSITIPVMDVKKRASVGWMESRPLAFLTLLVALFEKVVPNASFDLKRYSFNRSSPCEPPVNYFLIRELTLAGV